MLKLTMQALRKVSGEPNGKGTGPLGKSGPQTSGDGAGVSVQLKLRDIQQRTVRPEKARYRLKSWIDWVLVKCERFGGCMAQMTKVSYTVEQHMEGILAHWTTHCLSTGFLEGLNSVFSAVKRKARGYRSREYMIAMLYLVTGKVILSSILSH